MKTLTLRHSKLAPAPDDDVPLTIDGRPDRFAFDTGANISMMCEREAAHLGLAVNAVSTKVNDARKLTLREEEQQHQTVCGQVRATNRC